MKTSLTSCSERVWRRKLTAGNPSASCMASDFCNWWNLLQRFAVPVVTIRTCLVPLARLAHRRQPSLQSSGCAQAQPGWNGSSEDECSASAHITTKVSVLRASAFPSCTKGFRGLYLRKTRCTTSYLRTGSRHPRHPRVRLYPAIAARGLLDIRTRQARDL